MPRVPLGSIVGNFQKEKGIGKVYGKYESKFGPADIARYLSGSRRARSLLVLKIALKNTILIDSCIIAYGGTPKYAAKEVESARHYLNFLFL